MTDRRFDEPSLTDHEWTFVDKAREFAVEMIEPHIDLLELRLDLPGAHPPRVKCQHLLIETGQPTLAFLHQLRLETPVPIARHLDLEL